MCLPACSPFPPNTGSWPARPTRTCSGSRDDTDNCSQRKKGGKSFLTGLNCEENCSFRHSPIRLVYDNRRAVTHDRVADSHFKCCLGLTCSHDTSPVSLVTRNLGKESLWYYWRLLGFSNKVHILLCPAPFTLWCWYQNSRTTNIFCDT